MLARWSAFVLLLLVFLQAVRCAKEKRPTCEPEKAIEAVAQCWLEQNDALWLVGRERFDILQLMRDADWSSLWPLLDGGMWKDAERMLGAVHGKIDLKLALLAIGATDSSKPDAASEVRRRVCGAMNELLDCISSATPPLCSRAFDERIDRLSRVFDAAAPATGKLSSTTANQLVDRRDDTGRAQTSALRNLRWSSVQQLAGTAKCLLCDEDASKLRTVFEVLADGDQRLAFVDFLSRLGEESDARCALAEEILQLDRQFVVEIFIRQGCQMFKPMTCLAAELHQRLSALPNAIDRRRTLGVVADEMLRLVFTHVHGCPRIQRPLSAACGLEDDADDTEQDFVNVAGHIKEEPPENAASAPLHSSITLLFLFVVLLPL